MPKMNRSITCKSADRMRTTGRFLELHGNSWAPKTMGMQ